MADHGCTERADPSAACVFFSSRRRHTRYWRDWSSDVCSSDLATRQALVNQAGLLTDRINGLQRDLVQVRTEAQIQFDQLVGPTGDVLAAAREIASLNTAIRNATQQGVQPNDLLDRRDLALDRLSALGQVSVTDLGDNDIRVQFGDAAVALVDSATVTWPQALANPGGRLGALLRLSDTAPTGTITSFLNELDGFASQLINDVNSRHGTPFFSGTNAGDRK